MEGLRLYPNTDIFSGCSSLRQIERNELVLRSLQRSRNFIMTRDDDIINEEHFFWREEIEVLASSYTYLPPKIDTTIILNQIGIPEGWGKLTSVKAHQIESNSPPASTMQSCMICHSSLVDDNITSVL